MADDPTDESGGRRGRKGRRARRRAREEAAAEETPATEETPEEIQARSQWRKKAAAERIEDLKKEQENLQKILKTEQDTYALKELQKTLAETNAELLATHREHIRDLARTNREIPEELKKQTRELEKIVKEEEKRAKAVEESAQAAANLGKSLGQAFRVTRGGIIDVQNLGDKFEDMGKTLGNAKEGLLNFGKEFGKSFGGAYLQMVVDMATMLVNLAMEVENVGRNMRRTTGMSEELAGAIESAVPSVRDFTHEFEGLADAAAVLYRNFTNFSLINTEVASQLALEATMLNRLGVSYESYADSVQLATKALGVSADKSGDMMRDLTAYAMNIGMDVGQLTSGFAASREHVAKFGSDGVKAFKDLARTSKITGIDLQRLFAITSKFDTFEGAAEQAGMLNAALGGNFVNAMDLMMETDPKARFDMIRDAIKGAAGEFKDMEYYQRIFYARAAGLDNVAELALVMSGRYDLLGDKMKNNASDYVSMAEKAQTFQTVQDELATLFQRNIKILPDVMKAIEKVMRWLASPQGQKTITEFFTVAEKLVTGIANNIDGILAKLPMLAKATNTLGPLMAFLGPILAFGSGVAASVAGNKLTASNLPRWMGGQGKGGGGGGTPGSPMTRPTGGGTPGGTATARARASWAEGMTRKQMRADPRFKADQKAAKLARQNRNAPGKPGFFKRMTESFKKALSWSRRNQGGFIGNADAARSRMPAGRGGTRNPMFVTKGQRGFDIAKARELGKATAAAGDDAVVATSRFAKLKNFLGRANRALGKVAGPLAVVTSLWQGHTAVMDQQAKRTDKQLTQWEETNSMLGASIGYFISGSYEFADFLSGGFIDTFKGAIGMGGKSGDEFELTGGSGLLDFFMGDRVKKGQRFLATEATDIGNALDTLRNKTRGFFGADLIGGRANQMVDDQGLGSLKNTREFQNKQRKMQDALAKQADAGVAGAEDALIKHVEEFGSFQAPMPIDPRLKANLEQAELKKMHRQVRAELDRAGEHRLVERNVVPAGDNKVTVQLMLDGKVLDERTISTMGAAAGFSGITGYGFSG